MDTILKDYKAYYEARMKRRENSDVYIHSYLSEKALFDLVNSCESMEELMSKGETFRQLSLQNAIALVKDQEAYRKKIYEDCKEDIRAKGPIAILARIETVQNDMELVNMVNGVLQKNSVEITIDQLMSNFYSNFTALENIEVYQQAIVPEEWKAQCIRYAQEIIDSGRQLWKEEYLPAAQQWKPDWVLDYQLLYEERHRRLIPVNDDELMKKIALHKTYSQA